MLYALRLAVAGLRARRARTVLTASGVAAAALMLGVALTVTAGLTTGFDRAARKADLPTVAARFEDRDRAEIEQRVRRLPGLEDHAYRTEFTGARLLGPGGRRIDRGVLTIVDGKRRGYAIVEGRDVGASGDEAVVEQGLAREWGLRVGGTIRIGRVGSYRISGFALAPDNVAFPLVSTARVYVSRQGVERRFDALGLPVNVVLLWAAEGAREDVLLGQARVSAFGLRDLSFVTQEGVRVILSQAAGIVTALIAAFALIAAALAGVLLGAGAQSEVVRRRPVIGVQRAIGLSPGMVCAVHGAQAALVAAPAALAGIALGFVLARGPTERLLALLNELAPGGASSALLLGLAWVVVVLLVTASAALPAWSAARRPASASLRGGADLRRVRRDGRCAARGGLALLGARLVAARRARFAVIVGVMASAVGVVLLMVSLAGLLQRLRDDPATLGKRYQLSVRAPAEAASAIAAVPGVDDAQPRYSVNAANSFALGSPVRLIAYPGGATGFETPPLASGRRARGEREAEIGAGLADAQGLRPGSTLAVQLPSGAERRFRVSGVVRALENSGRLAYVRSAPLLAADPSIRGPVVVRLAPGADRARVSREIEAITGRPARTVGGATGGSSDALVEVIATVLRLLALTVGLICLYALIQTLALTTRERRLVIATLRASGADPAVLRRLLLGAAAAVCVPAALAGAGLELVVFGPAVARMTAGYADLSVRPGAGDLLIVAAFFALLALAATAWTARGLAREPVVRGLREAQA